MIAEETENDIFSSPFLGSGPDMEWVSRDPLKRARLALEYVLDPSLEDTPAGVEEDDDMEEDVDEDDNNDEEVDHSDDDAAVTTTKAASVILTDTQQAARLALAYVSLVTGDHARALELAQSILLVHSSSSSSTNPSSNNRITTTVAPVGRAPAATSTISSSNSTHTANSATTHLGESLRARQLATARLYAAEAACCLGDASQSLQFMKGVNGEWPSNNNLGQMTGVYDVTLTTNVPTLDVAIGLNNTNTTNTNNNNNNEAWLDRLASDLAGVTIETAAVSSKGKRRLARAQTLVRASASIVTATLGGPHNMTVAKQLAMSAQSMEETSLAPSGVFSYHHHHHHPSVTITPLPGATAAATAAAGGGDVGGGDPNSYTTTNNNTGGDVGVTSGVELVNRSLSRRALIYCNLRGGNSSAALSLLQSLRQR